jgi:tetratricopeptide (TPR) repeat protein
MDNTDINHDAFQGLNWIIKDAPQGFFFVLASHKMQERIANTYTADHNIATLNYSNIRQYNDLRLYDEQNIEHYKFRVLDKFADDHKEKKILFIQNFQILFPTAEDIHALNFSRDWIANKNKIWIFFMTPELEARFYLSAPDFHSYCNLKIKFEDMGIEETKQELLHLSDHILTIHQTNEIKERLTRYKEMEEEYLSHFETTVDGTVQLIRKGLSDSQLLAIANTLENIAKLYDKIGDYKKAIQIHEKILLIREKILNLQHTNVAESYNNIGISYDNLGDYNKAFECYNKALKITEKALGLQHSDTAAVYHNVGLVYAYMGNYNKALEYNSKALEIREKVLGLQHSDTATSYNGIGFVYSEMGDYDKALEYYDKALKIWEKIHGLQHPDTALSYHNIGANYYYTGEYNKALEYNNKALEIREKIQGLQHPDTADSYNNIGAVYYSMGNYNKALEYYNKALEICKKILGIEHSKTKNILEKITSLNDRINA